MKWGLPELPPRNGKIVVQFGANSTRPNVVALPQAKVGDTLAALLAQLGVTEQSVTLGGGSCSCASLKAKLNNAGIAGCRTRMDEFAADLRRRAKSAPFTTWVKAAAAAVGSGLAFKLNPLDPFPGLIEHAIRIEEQRLAAQGEQHGQ